jgi:tetratricopeptide (TPR) repeat protein
MLGVFAMKGPGIKRDERIYGASLLDIAPTVLSLFGLPVGRDMIGRVLTGAFVVPPETRWIDSWEATLPAAPSSPSTRPPLDLHAREASVRQLAALGYLCAEGVEGAQAARFAEQEARFNLATVHLHHGRPAAALALLQQLCDETALQPRYEVSRLLSLSRLSRHPEVLREVERLEAAGCVSAQFDLLAAAAWSAEGRGAEALERMDRAAAREPANPVVHQVAGDYRLARRRLAPAQACYAKAIELDPDNAQARSGMAQVALDLGDFEGAAEHALASLQHVFWNPLAQFRLGQALAGLGKRAEARRAFEHAVEQSPAFAEAHCRLAAMSDEEGDSFRAVAHRQRAVGISPAHPPA